MRWCRFSLLLAIVVGCAPAVKRVAWPVMGTVAAVQTRTSETGLAQVRARVADVFSDIETLLNAHVSDSELSKLSACSDSEVLTRCTPRVRACYALAFRMASASDGAFCPRWRGDATLDLGAIAKGFAVDRAAEETATHEGDLLIDLGGTLKAVSGTWQTGIADPSGTGCCAHVSLRPGEALATSAEYFRGKHIYDGRTHTPVTNGVASVTVLARSAMLADALSTTLFILGPDEGREFLRGAGSWAVADDLAVLWVMHDEGKVTFGKHVRF